MNDDGFGIGVDLVSIHKFERLIHNTGFPFIERVFTPTEVAMALERPDPVQSLAGRFALKEATIKALPGTPLTVLDMQKIDIGREYDGSPTVMLPRDVPYTVSGSISYDGDYAIGAAIILSTDE